MKKIAVILAGCGSRDGSEIHESVCTLLSISQLSGTYVCFAPDRRQVDCINHKTGEMMSDTRNLLVEAARIARGNIKELSELKTDDFDALIIPGGLGAAKNFSDYLSMDSDYSVDQQLKDIITDFNRKQKYIGAICIAPVLLAGSLCQNNYNIKITTGQGNEKVSQALKKNGCELEELLSSQICIDEKNKIVTVPAYMNDASLAEVYTGINLLVKHIINNC